MTSLWYACCSCGGCHVLNVQNSFYFIVCTSLFTCSQFNPVVITYCVKWTEAPLSSTWLDRDREVICEEVWKGWLPIYHCKKGTTGYSAFVHGVSNWWNYVLRTIPNTSELMTPMEQTIWYKLIPAITDRNAVSDIERNIFSLPCRLGGLRITNPTKSCTFQYDSSEKITAPLVNPILAKENVLMRSPFRDALALWYNWLPEQLPSQCACGFVRSHGQLSRFWTWF